MLASYSYIHYLLSIVLVPQGISPAVTKILKECKAQDNEEICCSSDPLTCIVHSTCHKHREGFVTHAMLLMARY